MRRRCGRRGLVHAARRRAFARLERPQALSQVVEDGAQLALAGFDLANATPGVYRENEGPDRDQP
jgi:hypothetical protein